MPTLDGTPGDDTLNGTAGDDTIYGYDGNDTINGGDGADGLLGWAGNDTVNGDGGNDFIGGMEGDDVLNGGGGDDWIIGGWGRDTMSGGDGNDLFEIHNGDIVAGETVDGGSGNDVVWIPRDVYAAFPVDITGVTFTNVETLRGDQGYFNRATVAQLSTFANIEGWFIFTTGDPIALSGVSATGLFQLANGGATFDATGSTTPAEGHLAISGGDGADTITGSDGEDLLNGGAGNDILNGGAGSDTFRGGAGVDQMYGGAGDDYFEFSANELVPGEILDGGTGFDAVYLYWEVYDLSGFAFTNIEGIAKAGVHAPDVYLTAAQFNGLTSIDARLYITSAQPVSLAGKSFADGSMVNLSTADNTVTMAGIVSGSPEIVGSTGNDNITGSGGADKLSGGGGNDTLSGGGGNDVLRSGTGVDNMDGGAGDDRLVVEDTDLAGDQYAGGDGVDTLVVSSLDISGLALTGIERVEGNNVSMTAAQLDALSAVHASSVILTTGGAVSLTGTAPAFYTLSAAGNALDLSGVTTTGAFSITGGAGFDSMIGRNLAGHTDYLLGNDGDDVLNGLAGDDWLDGGAGADTMTGGLGNDLMYGGVGDDTYYVDSAADNVFEGFSGGSNDRVFASVSYALQSDAEIERLATIDAAATSAIDLTGSAFANIIDGNAGSNTLHGLGGDDTLDGGAGADSMHGGTGDDAYVVDAAGDQLFEAAGEGEDRLSTTVSYTLAAGQHVEKLIAAGLNGITLTGNELDNEIYGTVSADVLDGGGGDDILFGSSFDVTGIDTMIGGAGDDVFFVDDGGDTIVEADGGGLDLVSTSVSYTLAAWVDSAMVTSNTLSVPLDITGNAIGNNISGNAGANVLRGLDGNDELYGFGGNDYLAGGNGSDRILGQEGNDLIDGGAGADEMIGGAGDDIMIVDDAGDIAFESPGEGTDTVYALVSYTLTANAHVEILAAGGADPTAAINLTGNGFANNLWANEAGNWLDGAGGNDALFGYGGGDYLDGGSGADFLVGGLGDDIYVVDDALDNVVEYAGEGSDRAYAMSSWTLSAGSAIEILIAGGPVIAGGRNLTGNELANNIWDDAGDNDLYGAAGADALFGFAGADYLDGGSDADFLVGGTGDDIYVVDTAGDLVVEQAGEGADTVYALVSYALASDAAIEILAAGGPDGMAAIGLTGSSVANNLWGNQGANTLFGLGGDDSLAGFGGDDYLDGGDGADTLVGGAGDDLFVVGTGDGIAEFAGEGSDRAYALSDYTLGAGVHVEVLAAGGADPNAAIALTGNELANNLWGNAGSNLLSGADGNDALFGFGGDDNLFGGAGDDFVIGGEGNDNLFAGAGADILVGEGGADSFLFYHAPGAGIATMGDFSVVDDLIVLDDAAFAGLTAGNLAAGAFVAGAAAADADDRVIYDAATGALWFDADGNGAGAALQFAALGGSPALAAGDFLVI